MALDIAASRREKHAGRVRSPDNPGFSKSLFANHWIKPGPIVSYRERQGVVGPADRSAPAVFRETRQTIRRR